MRHCSPWSTRYGGVGPIAPAPTPTGRGLAEAVGDVRSVHIPAVQRVHGCTDETRHVASTVDARWGVVGYVSRDHAANLTASYERPLEHRP